MPFAPETVERMYLCFSVDKTNLSTIVPENTFAEAGVN